MSNQKTLEKKVKKQDVAHPHDHAFQSAMRDLRVARDFLEHHLPETVRKQIDLNTLQQSKANHYLLTMIKYLIEKSEISDRNQFYHWVHNHLSPPLEEQTMTLAEQLRIEGMQQGMQKGIQQGMQQGLQQGKLEGEQMLLIQLLHRRFPNLKSDYEIRVKNARTEELLLWGERILDAKSIDEVFENF